MLSKPTRSITGLVCCLSLAACGSAGPAADGTTTVDTLPNGAVHVVNRPPNSEPGPILALEEELRIGSVHEAGPASFGQLKGIAVAEDGRIAVLDAQARELRVFDANRKHLVTHSRRGSGPGEFQNAFGLMVDPDERLWLPDQANARMAVFDFEDEADVI